MDPGTQRLTCTTSLLEVGERDSLLHRQGPFQSSKSGRGRSGVTPVPRNHV